MARVVIQIPKTVLQDIIKEKLNVRFYRVRTEKTPPIEHEEEVDQELFNKLRKGGYLDRFADISTKELINVNIIHLRKF